MAFPFFSRPKQALLPAKKEETHDGAELNQAIQLAVGEAMRKALTYASYIAFDGADDQGGYFGPEFDIQTTAGRLKGLYSREPWIYSAATKVARGLSSVPLRVYQVGGTDPVKNHPVQLLLDAGSPVQSNMEMKFSSGVDLMLGGNYFILLEEDLKTVAGVAPVELVTINYDTVNVRISSITVSDVAGLGKRVTFKREQIIQARIPNPSNVLYGLSPFAAAARPILLDRYKNEYEMAFYLRGATHQGVIETTEDLSKNRFQRLMRTFEQAFTGRSNWWRTLFLPKGASWKASTLTMKEMEHLDSLKENRKTILAVLGIPPSMVGLIEDVNRATAEQQERVFWNDTIRPLAMISASGWNNSYIVKEKFKGKIEVRPDFSGIDAIEGFVSAKKEKSDAMAPVFTIDEIREQVWRAKPIGDERGSLLISQVKAPGGVDPGMLALALSGRAPIPLPPTKAAAPDGYVCITLIFPKDQYDQEKAKLWAKEKQYPDKELVETSDSWVMHLVGTDGFEIDSIRTIILEDGVSGIYAKPRDGKAEADAVKAVRKAQAVASQGRIERLLGGEMNLAVERYVDELLSQARFALSERRNLRDYLKAKESERQTDWRERVAPLLERAMLRGFSLANSNVRMISTTRTKHAFFGEVKRDRFAGMNETDSQAVDVLRERGKDGQRRVLIERMLDRFVGLDATRTDIVIGIVEQGEKEGKSYEEIARTIRETYGEAYRNQARTVVKTEILSAVSQGLEWNHQVLTQIFSRVDKEWIHQGPDDLDSDARQEHVALDGTLAEADGTWTVIDPQDGVVKLRFPRDPNAPAGQVVNCGCTMVSNIPEDATSQAESILENS